MKMKWLSVLTALLCFAATATGQGRGFMYSVSTEVGNNFRKNTGFSPIDVAFTPGYAFDGRFFVGVPLTLSNELFRTDGIQNYENNFRMGISAGYNILSGHGTLVSLSAAFEEASTPNTTGRSTTTCVRNGALPPTSNRS